MALRSSTTFTRVVACLGVFAAASGARAEGIETTVSGTVGLGRAANMVRVNDFMATWQNPANLAVIPSSDLGAELRLPLLHACFDRSRDPDGASLSSMNRSPRSATRPARAVEAMV